MPSILGKLILASLAVAGVSSGLFADAPQPTKEQARFFENHVRPVLVENCIECHGPDKQENDLRLDSRAAMVKGGQGGAAVVAGQPDRSLLIEAIRRESLEMPPDTELNAGQIEHLANWIAAGAPWPRSYETLQRSAGKFTAEDRALWSLQPIGDPTLPETSANAWARNPLDLFVAEKLEANGLYPSQPAEPSTVMRRAYFDLIGLPPTAVEVDAYRAEAQRDPDAAYRRLVDRLLASPHYGERWARHWLDLVRYADSDGYKKDDYRPEAYRYRDYVVRSLNQDKPYDRFVREQLAGDEIDPGNADALIATMYLRHWIYEYNQRDVEGQWQAILNDVTETTGDVFLGMGFSCARCHDHKFDPILRKDYYRLQAFFAALAPRDEQPLASVEQQEQHQAKLTKWEVATEDLRRRLHAIEHPALLKHSGGEGFHRFVPEIKAMIRKRAADRNPYEHQIATMASRQFTVNRDQLASYIPASQKEEWHSLRTELTSFDHLKPPPLPQVMFVVSDVGSIAPATLIPGDDDQTPVEPGYPTVLDPGLASIARPATALQTTGRRTALAGWITSTGNPLTARVIVNRVWQYHFGRGLVDTPSDFGRLGQRPSHPELLDWLATRFIENGWRLKPLHRLIMHSATYRQTSAAPETSASAASGGPQLIDPENRLLWRMNAARLSAEQLRDAMLTTSGELNYQSGGPAVDRTSPRRTIYNRILRNQIDPLLNAFDVPDAITSMDRRTTTTTSTQALAMLNGPWALARARAFADRLADRDSEDKQALVREALQSAYGRAPSTSEQSAAVEFLDGMDSESLFDFCHALMNSNEFLYVD